MALDCDGYYTLRSILGYGCKYNVVLSDRGRGKSFYTKHFLMRQPGTAMCIYRQSSDMHMAMLSFIEPLVSKNKDLDKFELYDASQFEWDGNDKEGYILKFNGAPKIWMRYITQVNHIKQEVFPDDMNWVWWDEFIGLSTKKLPGIESELSALRTIVKTIEHDTQHDRKEKGLKEVRVLMFANPFTWSNSILHEMHLTPCVGIKRVGPGVVMEMLEPEPKKKQGKMTADDFLGNEVNENQGWRDETAFIVEWKGEFVPVMSVRIGSNYFTCYHKGNSNTMYIKSAHSHTDCNGTYKWDCWGNLDGLQEKESCLDGSQILKLFKDQINRGALRYYDLNSKFAFMNSIAEIR